MSKPISKVGVLVPAAGASSRMRGADKLLEDVDGQPLLARQVVAATTAGLPVLVTLRADRPARQHAISGLGAEMQIIDHPDEGLAASIRAGAVWAAARGIDLIVLLADLPEITAADIALLATTSAAHPGRILRATANDGTPGHPVLWPQALLGRLGMVRGDGGGRDILMAERERTIFVALSGTRATTDLDTPEAWAEWRQHRAPPRAPRDGT
jgi:molybdenum cofactor cytidylyltransferase